MYVQTSDLRFFFFFNDTATTEIYTLSLHDALPISRVDAPVAGRVSLEEDRVRRRGGGSEEERDRRAHEGPRAARSEEHTSELQSRQYLVCRLLLEKKKTNSLTSSYLYHLGASV